jgi:alpha-mannosidase
MAWREELAKHSYLPLGTVTFQAAFTKEQYRLKDALASLTFSPVTPGDCWGAKWEYGWFRGGFTAPESAAGQMIAVMLDAGGEAAVYIDGDYAGAMDKQHRSIILTDFAQAGRSYEVVLEAYAGHGPQEERSGPTPPNRETVPDPPDQQSMVGHSTFGIWQEVAFQLAIDVETLWEVRENFDADSLRVMEIDEGLKDFTLIADFEAPHGEMLASLQAARERLTPLLEKKNGDTTPEMVGFGNAHIDVAWLWPLAETERKCVRTFSTQLALMARYPEYQFFQSQPHLYVMVREKYPDLYEKIRAAAERGQWIANGAAWVEPDTNLSGGESLIRQLVHGKRFFKEEFGVDCELLWLPDVFGYSGALPQIMLGCGVPYFSTQKIFWAYHGGEAFPYNTFLWEGIDGSQVKAHFHNDYTSEVRPATVMLRWNERVQKDGFSSRLFPFGYGDGGGGPTREHLEFARRLKDLEGVPKFRIDDPMAFFRVQDEDGWPQDRYVGELYFQVHRGTYTSQARTKALNRRCEFALRAVELWGCAARALTGYEFPVQEWEAAWKTVLLNQFHDILPGSSIAKVYEEAESQLSGVLDRSAQMMKAIGHALVKQQVGVTVFNSLSWPRTELVELPPEIDGLAAENGTPVPMQTTGEKRFAEVSLPACGWKSFKPDDSHIPQNTLKVQKDSLENDLMSVTLNNFGEITSIFDKTNRCELTAGVCNQLKMYQDIPSAFDAWDIDSMYCQTPVDLSEPAEIEILAEGPLFASLVVRRKLNNSSMTQTITLRRNAYRVDFHTVIDWQERHKLLKVNFLVNYFAHEALHEIQFGHLARPTHRSRELDRDRFEVCNQKWSALVEGMRGFAILNDSKYGVDVLDNSINLTLLKSALAPDMTADRGRQDFTYAFYFWDGPFAESGLVQQGYQLNSAPQVFTGQAGSQSLFTLDRSNIILETVKPAEDGAQKDIVLRLYEALGSRTRVKLSTSLPIKAAYRTDMLETNLEALHFSDGSLSLEFRPFEIKTIRLQV